MSDVSLKEYFERLLLEMERRTDDQLRAAKELVTKAEIANEKRLDILNHYKAENAEKSAQFARKDEVARVLERVEALETASFKVYGGILVVALIGVANLVKLFW